MSSPKFSSFLISPTEAQEDDIRAYKDIRRSPLSLLGTEDIMPDRPIIPYRPGQYLRQVIATENKKLKSKL